MRAFLAALVLCCIMANVTVLVSPLSPSGPSDVLLLRKADACEPTKDRTRMAGGLNLPDLLPQRKVRTLSFVAADITPAQQAAETRKRKVAKR